MKKSRYSIKIDVIFEIDGKKVIDSRLAKLLLLIDKYGSILAASKALGIPYSRAWEAITRAERHLGERLIEARRGGKKGGGAYLTEAARTLLNDYLKAYKTLTKKELEIVEKEFTMPDLVYMGSHDPGVSFIAKLLKKKGITMETQWIGSGGGLAAVILGDADIAGTHLLDPSTDVYNLPYIEKCWYKPYLAVIRGYKRAIGFVTREKIDLENLIINLLKGKYRIINRQKASGSRFLLDNILAEWARKLGYHQEVIEKIPGYNVEAKTHFEVAEKVASGDADAGICIEWVARQYGLEFHRLRWENFDFVVRKSMLNNTKVKEFINILKSNEFRKHILNITGYMIDDNIGAIILQ